MSINTRDGLKPVRILLGIGILLVMVGSTLFLLNTLMQRDTSSGELFSNVSSQQGTLIDPPRAVIPFALTNHEGDVITLDTLKGRYSLVAFGYTHCPDVCPLTLTEFRRVKHELGEEHAEQVNFVFISVDGERDTPVVLNQYMERFDPEFIGITTEDAEKIAAVAESFSVYFAKRDVEGTQAAYLVDHTASTFLLNPKGELIRVFPFGTSAADVAASIQQML